MKLKEFAPTKGPGRNDSRDAYILLNYDLDNHRRQALVSIQVTNVSDYNFRIIESAINDASDSFEELGRDLGIFDSDEVNHTSGEKISRSQFPDIEYDLQVQSGPTIDIGWFADATQLPLQ